MRGGRLQEVPSVVIWLGNVWYFGKLASEERYSRIRGSTLYWHIRPVSAHGIKHARLILWRVDNALHQISRCPVDKCWKINCAIHRIVINPTDSVIYLLSNQCWHFININRQCFRTCSKTSSTFAGKEFKIVDGGIRMAGKNSWYEWRRHIWPEKTWEWATRVWWEWTECYNRRSSFWREKQHAVKGAAHYGWESRLDGSDTWERKRL